MAKSELLSDVVQLPAAACGRSDRQVVALEQVSIDPTLTCVLLYCGHTRPFRGLLWGREITLRHQKISLFVN